MPIEVPFATLRRPIATASPTSLLFNSAIFLFAFLPAVLAGFLLLERTTPLPFRWLWLTLASAVFYGYWDIRFLPLLAGSILVNYLIGAAIARCTGTARSAWLAAGVTFNLALLGWFKYANFLVDSLNATGPWQLDLARLVLPIGISFFTFQQIAFLVDVYRRETSDFDPLRYALFISFFPQLIAGPIVHHREVMPQLQAGRRRPVVDDLAVGLMIFVIGLFKKMAIADSLATNVAPAFDAAAAGQLPLFAEAWAALLCYALQIYFDFSGYSDMAVGLARMFGIVLPINFASPYKATSIIDFWRRWHITLSRFLRDYLYIPLGGSRVGPARRYVNVFATMLLGGLWHGAGWTFLLWGGLHGALITVNQWWIGRCGAKAAARGPAAIWLARIGTTLLVTLAWVPFRADDLAATGAFYVALAGAGGFEAESMHLLDSDIALLALASLLGCWVLPNTYEFLRRTRPGLASRGYPATEIPTGGRHGLTPAWQPTRLCAAVGALLFTVCILKLNDISDFIYWRF